MAAAVGVAAEAAAASVPDLSGGISQVMLAPKRVELPPPASKPAQHGLSRGRQHVKYGEYSLKALEAGWLTNRQIEAARIAMTRKIKRGGKVWINVFPDKSFTKKPAETPHGLRQGLARGLGRRGQARAA